MNIKTLRHLWLAIIILVIFPTNICAQSIKEQAENGDKVAQYQYARSLTKRLSKEADYQKAFTWLKKSAEQGYAPAQCSLGYSYWAGQGITKDYEQAVYWYRKSADQGDETAQYNLAVCYANGQGVSRSDSAAFQWYKKSAEQGYISAEYALGKVYYYGKGVTENNNLAFEWFNKAASHKHSGAMYFLGECYARGHGVSKDITKAIEWFEKSAKDDNTDAEYALALLYLEGNGIKKDSIEAADLLLHSAGGGWCSPHQLYSYDKNNSNSKAQKKLIELSKLDGSKNQHYFLAIVGCMYDAIQDYSNAEKYYKLAINKGSYLGMIELGLMYFYICANNPDLYSYYDKFQEGSETLENENEVLGLESYMYPDNKPCIEYVKTKQWTETDNAAYWLEKAISYGVGSFEYGAMSYDLYSHLLFVYVDGVGSNRNLEKAIDVVYKGLTDSTYDSKSLYMHLETTLEIAEKHSEYYTKLFNTYRNLNNYVENNPNSKNVAKKVAYGGLGKCYYKGFGVTKDYKKAFNYLSEAVKYDNCESMRLLAACYRYGRGVQEANNEKDKEWSAKAEQCGDERAKKLAELRGN